MRNEQAIVANCRDHPDRDETAVLILLGSVGSTISTLSLSALAAPLQADTPKIASTDPSSAPNDIDTPIVISGGGAPGMAGTQTHVEATGALVSAGVYRYTTGIPRWYLPLALTGFTP